MDIDLPLAPGILALQQGFLQAPALAWPLVALGIGLSILAGLAAWAALAGRLLKALQRNEGRRAIAGSIVIAVSGMLMLYLGCDALIGSPTNYFRMAQTDENAVVPVVIAFARMVVVGTALWPPLLGLAWGMLLGTSQRNSRRPSGVLFKLGVLAGHSFAFWWPRPPLDAETGISGSELESEAMEYELTLASGETVEAEEHEYISNILELGETTARDVMRPRPDVVALDIAWPPQRIIDIVAGSRHSRFPVYEESIDNVVGVLHLRDMLEFLARGEEPGKLQVREMLLDALFLPETKKADDILRLLQKSKSHLAVVLDEYGGTAGILTIEDLLEEIVGEIQDEYDDEAKLYYQRADGAWVVDAQVVLAELNSLLGAEFMVEDVETLGGLVTHALGRIPSQGDMLCLDAAGEPADDPHERGVPPEAIGGARPAGPLQIGVTTGSLRTAAYRLTVMSVERNRVGRVLIEQV